MSSISLGQNSSPNILIMLKDEEHILPYFSKKLHGSRKYDHIMYVCIFISDDHAASLLYLVCIAPLSHVNEMAIMTWQNQLVKVILKILLFGCKEKKLVIICYDDIFSVNKGSDMTCWLLHSNMMS